MLNSFFIATSAFCNLIMVLEPYEGHNDPACDRRGNSLQVPSRKVGGER